MINTNDSQLKESLIAAYFGDKEDVGHDSIKQWGVRFDYEIILDLFMNVKLKYLELFSCGDRFYFIHSDIEEARQIYLFPKEFTKVEQVVTHVSSLVKMYESGVKKGRELFQRELRTMLGVVSGEYVDWRLDKIS